MTETIKLQKATFTVEGGHTVTELIYADAADLEAATASIVIRMPSVRVKQPAEMKTAQVEVLDRALNLLSQEIAHLR